MDLNQLLYHHQRALIASGAISASHKARRWADHCADYFADRITETRVTLGREDPFTWQGKGGIICCG